MATPATVDTLGPNTALPLPAQREEKVTSCGVVTGTPPLATVTVKLVVPKADSAAAPTPRVGAETVTAVAPTEKPIEPLVAAGGVPTCAVAVMVPAPAAASEAGASLTVATPVVESVKAVPAVGVIVARVASVLKVTTTLGTIAPAASLTVAFTVAGLAVDMEVSMAPEASARASVIVATGARVVVVGVGTVDDVGLGVVPPPSPASPEPQPASRESAVARNSATENLEIPGFFKFRVK
jgi:hypothetical protein